MCIKMYILAKSSVRQFCSWEYSTNFMNPWSRTLVDTEKHLVQHLFCVQWSTTLGFSSEVPGLPFLDVDPKPDIISFHQKSAQSILPLFVKFQKVVVPWKIGKLGGQLAPSLRSTTQAILLCHSDVARNSVAYPKCYLVTMDTTRFQWSNEQNWIRKKKSRVFLFPSDHNQLHTFPNPKKKNSTKFKTNPEGIPQPWAIHTFGIPVLSICFYAIGFPLPYCGGPSRKAEASALRWRSKDVLNLVEGEAYGNNLPLGWLPLRKSSIC